MATPFPESHPAPGGPGVDAADRILRWLPAAIALVAAAGTAAAVAAPWLQPSAIGRTLLAAGHLDSEQGIGTWLGASLLLAGAFLCFCRACACSGGGGDRRTWLALAAAVAAMSMDEVVGLHERLGNAVARAVPIGLDTFAWILPGAAAVGIAALLLLGFLRRQPPDLRLGLIAAGSCYFGGALGCEAVGSWIYVQGGKESCAFEVEVIFEETLELTGAYLLLRALRRAPPPDLTA